MKSLLVTLALFSGVFATSFSLPENPNTIRAIVDKRCSNASQCGWIPSVWSCGCSKAPDSSNKTCGNIYSKSNLIKLGFMGNSKKKWRFKLERQMLCKPKMVVPEPDQGNDMRKRKRKRVIDEEYEAVETEMGGPRASVCMEPEPFDWGVDTEECGCVDNRCVEEEVVE